jgi:alpha-glucosidase
VVFDYLRQKRGDDFMFFARAGGVGTQAVAPVVWSGDPSASFDDVKGLPANVRAGINAGISGIAFWGSDISGYTCLNDPPADKEVYLRWAEFGALSTDMHDENACSQAPPGAPPKWTLWSDTETTQVYGQYASLHTRLLPYTYAAALEAVQTGVPIMRHPVLFYPGDAGAIADEFDYFFGPSLYVAPVVRRGQTSQALWLPPGRWIDWWTMDAQPGDAMVTKDAPLDVLPLYQRSGSIVPLLDPSIDTLAPATTPGIVSLDDVKGILDLRTVLDAGAGASARASLTDGTKLAARLGSGSAALPAGATMASEADLATCSLCGRIDSLPGGATRLRVTSAPATNASLNAGSVTLSHSAPSPLRARWDIVVLP